MENKEKWGWGESLPILENAISDFGIYDVVAKLSRENIVAHIYRTKIEKDSIVDFGENDNQKILLILQGSCTVNQNFLEVGSYLYLPEKFSHTLKTDEGLELLIIKFNVRR